MSAEWSENPKGFFEDDVEWTEQGSQNNQPARGASGLVDVMGPMEPCRSKPHAGQEKITIDGHEFYADKELIPLLQELNKAGLKTYSHCSGHSEGSRSWIVLDAENMDSVEVRISDRTKRRQLLISWKREGA